MDRPAIIDPGIGSEKAAVGTVEWAQRVRLRMQGLVNDVDTKPDALRRYYDIAKQYRAWTLLNKPDNSRFKTWDEFCEFRQPWGLGKPWKELKPYVEAVAGKNATDVMTAPPAQHGNRFTVETDTVSVSTPGAKRKAERMRAVLRAPAEIQDLFREEMISQSLAVKLGPKKPTEEQLEQQKQVVLALRDVPRERKAVDARVREVLGQKRDKVAELVRAFKRLSAAEQKRFLAEVSK